MITEEQLKKLKVLHSEYRMQSNDAFQRHIKAYVEYDVWKEACDKLQRLIDEFTEPEHKKGVPLPANHLKVN